MAAVAPGRNLIPDPLWRRDQTHLIRGGHDAARAALASMWLFADGDAGAYTRALLEAK